MVPSGSHYPESLDSNFENLMVYYSIMYSQAEGDLGWKYVFLTAFYLLVIAQNPFYYFSLHLGILQNFK